MPSTQRDEAPALSMDEAPETGSLERWAWDYIVTTEIGLKLQPPEAPQTLPDASCGSIRPMRPIRRVRPGRPPELEVTKKSRVPKRGLRGERTRARLLHAFAHHELQAAELMCWALLAFPEAPDELRRGLHRIALDEIRHLDLYRQQIERLGFYFGAFPVRDWFWERVPRVRTIMEFLAVMGMGLEGANLDHSAAFARRFRAVGDEESAEVQEIIGRDEIEHVRFGVRWFRALQQLESKGGDGGQDDEFDRWAALLPAPLSPMLMRGSTIARRSRLEAGLSPAMVDRLERWKSDDPAPGS